MDTDQDLHHRHRRTSKGVLTHKRATSRRTPALGYTREDYAEHLRTEYSTFRWLLEPMLDAAGFEIVEADYTGSLYGAYTCVKRGQAG
ncbi:hypothetical protein [Actinacidiphila oryziradicis]|uniref:hypothetical protein n=1 Tax=Actinacidiphila oryziradicis TaxID=2571141 RepID=UPI001B80CA57|nr:hypothetical protein [Actinacidiphila oryziradicis]